MCACMKVGLEPDKEEMIDLGQAGDADNGSVCDIVVRDYISIRQEYQLQEEMYHEISEIFKEVNILVI